MASLQKITGKQVLAKQQRFAPAVAFRPARLAVMAKAQAQESSRRQVVQAGVAALLGFTMLPAAPARAGLFGDDGAADAAYVAETSNVLGEVREALAFTRDDPELDAKVKKVRGDINSWVAKYRRNTRFEGRPSYGNTYSVCNALAGHYNSFGNEAPVPKKRLERLVKELGDAESLLARGR